MSFILAIVVSAVGSTGREGLVFLINRGNYVRFFQHHGDVVTAYDLPRYFHPIPASSFSQQFATIAGEMPYSMRAVHKTTALVLILHPMYSFRLGSLLLCKARCSTSLDEE